MDLNRVPSDNQYKDVLLSYLDEIPRELRQDILYQSVNYMIHFSGDTVIDTSPKTRQERAIENQEFDDKTQEPLEALTRLLHPYTSKQLSMFIQELEGKTNPYSEPDEVYPLPEELINLVEEAAQVYQQRQAKIIEELGNNFDK